MSDRDAFFKKINKKTEIPLDTTRPFVIFLDAADTTSNTEIDLLNEKEGSFVWCIQQTCKEMSKKYGKSIFIYAVSDEINICVLRPIDFKAYFKNEHSKYATELRDMILQEFFYGMFTRYKKAVYFHCWYMSLYEDNLYSYLICRKHRGINAMTYYYIKRHASGDFKNMCNGKKLNEVNKMCENSIEGYDKRTLWQKEGLVFYNGTICSVEDVLKKHVFSPIAYNGTHKGKTVPYTDSDTEIIHDNKETFVL